VKSPLTIYKSAVFTHIVVVKASLVSDGRARPDPPETETEFGPIGRAGPEIP